MADSNSGWPRQPDLVQAGAWRIEKRARATQTLNGADHLRALCAKGRFRPARDGRFRLGRGATAEEAEERTSEADVEGANEIWGPTWGPKSGVGCPERPREAM
jgi:hypothetical protein